MKPCSLTIGAACLLGATLLAGCRTEPAGGGMVRDAGPAVKERAAKARIYPGLDKYHRAITTRSRRAQRFFDQGLVLCFGFNHDEAIRSFEEAARLDPNAPMPWWGVAFAHGMNINDRFMTDERWRAGTEAAAKAVERIDRASPVEAALVRAVAARYSWPPPAEQRTLDEAYAREMEAARRQFPDDLDVATLFAESLMNLQPWDYWENDGASKGRIDEIVATIESVLERVPDHPGAMHLYIHAVEASANPDRAVAAADRLRRRVPGAGHLVHMPSHIDIRVGRYADAADTNAKAVAADRKYLSSAPPATVYNVYYAHNMHFLAYASMMEGRFDTAIKAARDLEREVPEEPLRQLAGLIEGIMPTTYHVLIRFGKWEEILAEPQRPEFRLVSRAVHHYARGIALAALGRLDEARREVEAFDRAAAEIPGEWYIFNNQVHTVLPIARKMLEGELAFREGRHEEAFSALREAVAMEDALIYDEPPGWMLPVRHPLGAFLMSSGRYQEAEAVYRADLQRNRDNGWALLGLSQALTAQNRDATSVRTRLARAWSRADGGLTSSCLCEPPTQWRVRAGR